MKATKPAILGVLFALSVVWSTLPAQSPSSGVPLRLESRANAWDLVVDCQSSTGALFLHYAPDLRALSGSPTLMLQTNTPLANGLRLPVLPSNQAFFSATHWPGRFVDDFVPPGPAEEDVPFSPLSVIGVSGVPETMSNDTPFTCTFMLSGCDGLPLKVSGPARVVLLDNDNLTAAFPHSMTPSTVYFSNGVAAASISIAATHHLAGCSLGLAASGAPTRVQGSAVAATSTIAQAQSGLTLEDLLSSIPLATSLLPPGLPSPDDPDILNKLNQYYENLRQTCGINTPGWGYPLAGGLSYFTGNFGEWYREDKKGGEPRIHAGVDIKADAGTEVLAAERGLVTYISKSQNPAACIIVDHGYGLWTIYQHVVVTNPQCRVVKGRCVAKGDILTEVLDYGLPGSNGDHLHFGIRQARNPSENRIFFPSDPREHPGQFINPARDPAFHAIAFPTTKPAPAIWEVVLIPPSKNPSTYRYQHGFEEASRLSNPGVSGSVYVLVQAVEQEPHGNLLAPWRVSINNTLPNGTIAGVELRFDDWRKDDLSTSIRYMPNPPLVSGGSPDCGIAHYSTPNPIPRDEKFRYWLKWDTRPFKSSPLGPREFTVVAEDAGGLRSPACNFVFGPRIQNDAVQPLGNNQYRVKVIPHLGCGDRRIPAAQPDQYRFLLLNAQGAEVSASKYFWTGVGGGTPFVTSWLVPNYGLEGLIAPQTYDLTLRDSTLDPNTLKVRVESVLVPDLAHEVPLLGCDCNPVAAPPALVTPVANMVWIHCGTFTMGSPDIEPARESAEGPQTEVTICRGFWMGQYEVTQGEYLALMGNNPSRFNGGSDGTNLKRPVEMVSWSAAVAYCAALTERERSEGRLPAGYAYRLPTEAEWEYACRAGTKTPFSFGSELHSENEYVNFNGRCEYPVCGDSPYCCYNSNGVALITVSVGSYFPNVWGLYDMHGNVSEWCRDWYGDYRGESVSDPQGAPSGTLRVVRGGSWCVGGRYCRSAFRIGTFPDGRLNGGTVGFRVVLAPGQ